MDVIYRVFRVNPQIIIKHVEGESCLIDPYRRVMVRMNAVASEIFCLVDGTRSVGAIIEEMRERFEAREDIVRRDVLNTLKEFAKKEIIV
jgi:hypothetical protein